MCFGIKARRAKQGEALAMLFVQDTVPAGLPTLTACHVSAHSRPPSRSLTCGTPTLSLPYTLGAGTAELTFIQPHVPAPRVL